MGPDSERSAVSEIDRPRVLQVGIHRSPHWVSPKWGVRDFLRYNLAVHASRVSSSRTDSSRGELATGIPPDVAVSLGAEKCSLPFGNRLVCALDRPKNAEDFSAFPADIRGNRQK